MGLVILLLMTAVGLSSGDVVDPFYVKPGNVSILALFDLHLGVHDNGDCYNMDVKAMERAFSVLWSSSQSQPGLLLYDTCGSPARALKIVRQTFLEDVCNSTQTTSIAAVLVNASSSVSDVISMTLRLTELLVVTVDPAPLQGREPLAHHLAVESLAIRKIEAAVLALVKLNWTYITVVSDTTISTEEYLLFFRLLRDRGICWQYSTSGTDPTNLLIHPGDIKTSGVVLFTSDLTFAGRFAETLPSAVTVMVVTNDARSPEGLLKNAIVLADTLPAMLDLAMYLGLDFRNDAHVNDATKQYFEQNLNCSLFETSGSQTCNGAELEAYFTRRTSERDLNLAIDSFDFLQSAVQLMISQGCSSFDINSCSLVEGIVSGNTTLQNVSLLVVDNRLQLAPNIISLTWITEGGRSMKFAEYTTADELEMFPQVLEAITVPGSDGIPNSTCDGWCPTCDSVTCQSGDPSKDQYYFTPGDILLAGMFPFSNRGDSPLTCGSYALHKFGNVYSEAFLYAIRAFHNAYPYLLPNVSVGSLVLDTCSDVDIALKRILDFESCQYTFGEDGNGFQPAPNLVPGYLVLTNGIDVKTMSEDFQRLDKIGAILDSDGKMAINGRSPGDDSFYLSFKAVLRFLQHMNWQHVGIVVSRKIDTSGSMNDFLEMALAKNICISFYHRLISNEPNSSRAAVDTIKESLANVVLIMVTGDDAKGLFSSIRQTDYLSRNWVLGNVGADLQDRTDISLPVGTMVLEDRGQQNRGFNQRYPSIDSTSSNPWSVSFNQEESGCQESSCRQQTNSQTFMVASVVIKAVDTMLHALHMAYVQLCPEQTGLCPQFREEGFGRALASSSNVTFLYQNEEKIRFMKDDGESLQGAFDISIFQNSGFEVIGSVIYGNVDVDRGRIKYYDSRGVQLARPRESMCYSDCRCLNNKTEDDGPATSGLRLEDLDQEMGFQPSTGRFNAKLWTFIVVGIAASGSFIAIVIMVYILCKICGSALVRRYLPLGPLLLVAIVFLFLSTLPFLFSPSESVCGMQVFAHGFSYAFCYAIFLTKMTSLRDYKHIGLGGEISRINQTLSVFFVTGVQVAIGVQWWVMQRPMSVSEQVLTDAESGTQEMTYYACQLDRKDFVAYHSYVLLVLVLCCFYSIGVRNETQNMKEARLLLVSSWISLVLWTAIIVTILVFDRQHFEFIASVGLLANALTVIMVVFIPTLCVISRLRYEVSSKPVENGELFPDFKLERPGSLPHLASHSSSLADIANSYRSSFTTFESRTPEG